MIDDARKYCGRSHTENVRQQITDDRNKTKDEIDTLKRQLRFLQQRYAALQTTLSVLSEYQ